MSLEVNLESFESQIEMGSRIKNFMSRLYSLNMTINYIIIYLVSLCCSMILAQESSTEATTVATEETTVATEATTEGATSTTTAAAAETTAAETTAASTTDTTTAASNVGGLCATEIAAATTCANNCFQTRNCSGCSQELSDLKNCLKV